MKAWKVLDLYGCDEDLEWQLNKLESEGATIKEIIGIEKHTYKIVYTIEDLIEE